MAMWGCVGLFRALYGMCGYIQLFKAMYGYVGLCRAV